MFAQFSWTRFLLTFCGIICANKEKRKKECNYVLGVFVSASWGEFSTFYKQMTHEDYCKHFCQMISLVQQLKWKVILRGKITSETNTSIKLSFEKESICYNWENANGITGIHDKYYLYLAANFFNANKGDLPSGRPASGRGLTPDLVY